MDIAIVGIGCRYPGARGPRQLWEVLEAGRCLVGDVPSDRWDADVVFDAEKPIPKRGAFLEDVRSFDAPFFGIAPREAAQMDPQQRILLEVAWEMLEDAGMAATRLAGSKTGVYVGAIWHDYELVHLRGRGTVTAHTAVGQSTDIIAARISYALGLRGASLTINTGCSSSLVALHLACQAIRAGECDAAIVGGTNIMLAPDVMVGLTHFGGLAPDGVSKAFSGAVDGFGRGEGVAAIMVRPLAHALRDGQRVYCVVRGTGVNNDGGGRQLTAPTVEGQAELLRDVYARAGIDPQRVEYVEAHGTGTPAGDPVEAEALGTVLGAGRDRARALRIGSIKTNIGHQEGGAGVAGVIKVALALFHGRIPASLHALPLNPDIDYDRLGLQAQTEASPFCSETEDASALAGVSSFGWGGTNAHAILQGAPVAPSRPAPASAHGLGVGRNDRVVLLSARSPRSLALQATNIAAWLSRRPGELDAACATLARGRTHLAHRIAVVGDSAESLAATLRDVAASPIGATGTTSERPRKLVFVFPGQGSQWAGMARALLACEPAFAASVARCESALQPFVDWSLTEVLANPERIEWLERVEVIQCALWAMQVSLAALWRAWGIVPDVVVGHSMGEVAAACVAGHIDLADGARIIAERSRLAKRQSGKGGMLHVALSADAAAQIVRGYESLVSVAVSASAQATVLSGDGHALEEIQQILESQDVFCRRVRVDYASHSPQMDPILADLCAVLESVRGHEGTTPMVSTVLRRVVEGTELGSDYWAKNLRLPVQFADVVQTLAKDGHEVYLEVSPHPVLVSAIEENLRTANVDGAVFSTLRRDFGERSEMLARFGDLYAAGIVPDFRAEGLFAPSAPVDLPTYPWDHDRVWFDARPGSVSSGTRTKHALLRGSFATALRRPTMFFTANVSLEETPFLQDHVVGEAIVFPAAGFLDMAMAAAYEMRPGAVWSIEDMTMGHPLVLAPQGAPEVQVIVEEVGPDSLRFSIVSTAEGDEPTAAPTHAMHHARGHLRTGSAAGDCAAPMSPSVGNLDALDVGAFYSALAGRGLHYGQAFRGVTGLRVGPDCAAGEVVASDAARSQLPLFKAHPALLDAALQVSLAAAGLVTSNGPTHVPVRIGRASLHAAWPARVRVRAWREVGTAANAANAINAANARGGTGATRIELGVAIVAEDGSPVATLRRIALAPLPDAPATTDATRPLLVESTFRHAARRESGAVPPTSWIIFDFAGQGEVLHRALVLQGHSSELVSHAEGAVFGRQSDTSQSDTSQSDTWQSGTWQGDLGNDDAPYAWLSERRPAHVVVLGGGFEDIEQTPFSETFREAEASVVASARIIAVLAERADAERPRLALVTSAVHRVSGAERLHPEWAGLWGVGRVADYEHPEVRCVRIDVDALEPALDALVREIVASDADDEVALRGDDRFVGRLGLANLAAHSAPRTLTAASSTHYRLESLGQGSIDQLALVATGSPPLAEQRVRVEISHAALNFIDLMKALGIYPGDAPGTPRLGGECCGRVVAIGSAAETDLAIGDLVVATVDGALASHVDASPDDLVRAPPALSAAEAASYPLVFMTAWYALHHLARVERGERILIHSGTGGLGLAAIQLAQRAGLEVIATAGSAEKRALLQRMGVAAVFDSRSLAFAQGVMDFTRGEGVDVVLNSLSGEALGASVSTLRFGGRFLEVGKRDIYGGGELEMHHFQKAIAFFAIDLATLHIAKPRLFRRVLDEVTTAFARGELDPLPVEHFEARNVGAAFERMARAEHVGKIVVDMRAADTVRSRALPLGRAREDGAYVVSGGLGSLGSATAEWLVARGASHVILLGRTGPGPEAKNAIARMQSAGARVTVLACDVGSYDALSDALAPVLAEGTLRGVVHAAGLLSDATLANLTRDQVARVFWPKVRGAWNLSRITERAALDFFVLFSSAASLLGSAGQGAYCAANACLDALARDRVARSLPGTSIHLGPISGTGLAAASTDRGDRLAARGMGGMTIDEMLDGFEQILTHGGVDLGVLRLDTRLWKEAYPALSALTRWSNMLQSSYGTDRADGTDASTELRTRLAALGPERRLLEMENAVRGLVSIVLRLPEERIGRTTPFGGMGLDSLLGLELRNRFEKALGVRLPSTFLWKYPTVQRLAVALLEKADLGGTQEPTLAVAVKASRPAAEVISAVGDQLASEFDAELALINSLT